MAASRWRLGPGHYTGVEPLGELLGLGRFLVVRHGLTEHRANLHTLAEWDAVARGKGFDFESDGTVWVSSEGTFGFPLEPGQVIIADDGGD